MTDTIQVWRDAEGNYRWKRLAANNELISESGEGYQNKGHAHLMASRLNPGIRVDDLTEEE